MDTPTARSTGAAHLGVHWEIELSRFVTGALEQADQRDWIYFVI